MPSLVVIEKFPLGEFHSFGVEVGYSEEELHQLAQDAGVNAPTRTELMRREVELGMSEGRLVTVMTAVKAGALDLDTAKDILKSWKPGV